MKNLIAILFASSLVPAMGVPIEGTVLFSDFLAPDVQVWDGQPIGSEYTTGLWWGITSNPGTFSLIQESLTSYFGTTGGDTATDGAGLFDGGRVTVSGAVRGQQVYVQQRIWLGPDLATSPAVGLGTVFGIALGGGAIPALTVPAEGVTIYEASPVIRTPDGGATMALLGLGMAGVLIARGRRE